MDRHSVAHRAVRRDLCWLPDRLHADRRRARIRVDRPWPIDAVPHDPPVFLRHEGNDACIGALFSVHGLSARAIGIDGAAVPRRAAYARISSRIAVPRGAHYGDDFRRGDWYRGLVR